MPQGTPVKHKKKSKSVLKNARKAQRRTAVNRMNRTRVRTAIRRVRAAIASGDSASAQQLISATYAELDRAIRKHTLAENAANRYKSRLTLAANALPSKA